MKLEDLEHIFKPQLDEGTDSLYYMLIEGDRKLIQRHPAVNIEALLPMLDSFQYCGTVERLPRFTK
jgi:hypothetical protein